jgi:hypothetical protein
LDTQWNETSSCQCAACAEAGIDIAAAGVYLCGLIELVRERRITHQWITGLKYKLVALSLPSVSGTYTDTNRDEIPHQQLCSFVPNVADGSGMKCSLELFSWNLED